MVELSDEEAKADSQNRQEKELKEELEETWESFLEKLDFRAKPSKQKNAGNSKNIN